MEILPRVLPISSCSSRLIRKRSFNKVCWLSTFLLSAYCSSIDCLSSFVRLITVSSKRRFSNCKRRERYQINSHTMKAKPDIYNRYAHQLFHQGGRIVKL